MSYYFKDILIFGSLYNNYEPLLTNSGNLQAVRANKDNSEVTIREFHDEEN